MLPSCKSLRRPVQWLRDSVVATSYLQCNNFVANATECTSINFAQSRAASKFGRIQSSTSAFLPSSPPFLSLSLSLLCLRCSLSFFPSFSSHQHTNLTLNVRPRARRHAYSSRVFLTINDFTDGNKLHSMTLMMLAGPKDVILTLIDWHSNITLKCFKKNLFSVKFGCQSTAFPYRFLRTTIIMESCYVVYFHRWKHCRPIDR